jgi:acetyl-CoA carboxylase biotin carboxyl carrier protein
MVKKAKLHRDSDKVVGGVDLTEIERLLEFMKKHRLEQFEYEGGGVHIMLKKASEQSAGTPPRYEAAPNEQAQTSTDPAVAMASTEKHLAAQAAAADLHLIKSPIVGTFYAAASPGADPFVTVGTRIEDGQVLCIIEAMKLMNEIEADQAGEVAEIYVENGHPVEYGEPLFGIRPNRKK